MISIAWSMVVPAKSGWSWISISKLTPPSCATWISVLHAVGVDAAVGQVRPQERGEGAVRAGALFIHDGRDDHIALGPEPGRLQAVERHRLRGDA